MTPQTADEKPKPQTKEGFTMTEKQTADEKQINRGAVKRMAASTPEGMQCAGASPVSSAHLILKQELLDALAKERSPTMGSWEVYKEALDTHEREKIETLASLAASRILAERSVHKTNMEEKDDFYEAELAKERAKCKVGCLER